MVQFGIACPHKVIATGLYRVAASRKASESGMRTTSAVEESAADKQSSFYASQKRGRLQQCVQRRILKYAGLLR